jgi:hypothetical protein
MGDRCLTLPNIGVGGLQCARCVGLGKGGECCDVGPHSPPVRVRFADSSTATQGDTQACSRRDRRRACVQSDPSREPQNSDSRHDR